MIDAVLDFVSENRHWAAPVAFVCAFGETLVVVSAVVPATGVILGAGALTVAGAVDFWPLFWGGWLGSVAGSLASWTAGRCFGPALLRRRRVRARIGTANILRSQRLMRRWGAPMVAAGHVTEPLRSVSFALAGLAAMPLRLFLPMTMLGAVVWAWAIPTAGALGGTMLDALLSLV
jgi:membrane protein DedA with SNARE-associated domain